MFKTNLSNMFYFCMYNDQLREFKWRPYVTEHNCLETLLLCQDHQCFWSCAGYCHIEAHLARNFQCHSHSLEICIKTISFVWYNVTLCSVSRKFIAFPCFHNLEMRRKRVTSYTSSRRISSSKEFRSLTNVLTERKQQFPPIDDALFFSHFLCPSPAFRHAKSGQKRKTK
jgi:hypothetical protein